MKYIIKNCPCYFKNECLNTPMDVFEDCININDCLLKQIVEKCKEARRTGRKAYLPIDILNLLEIEETEE